MQLLWVPRAGSTNAKRTKKFKFIPAPVLRPYLPLGALARDGRINLKLVEPAFLS